MLCAAASKIGTLVAAIMLVATIASANEYLPDLTLTDLEDRPIALNELRGRVVLLDLCASWCLVCRQSLPFYAELQRQHADDVSVIAVTIDDDADDARAFARTIPAPIRVAHDADAEQAATLGLQAMPTLVIADRTGRVRLRHQSFRPEDRATIEKLVAELVREK